MLLDNIFASLNPWYPAISAFLFFAFMRYIYKNFVLRLLRLITDRISLKQGEELLDAFESPINAMLYICGIYAAVNAAPVEALSDWTMADKIMRSCIIFCFFWGCYNASGSTKGLLVTVLDTAGLRTEESLTNIISTMLRFLIVLFGFVTIAKEWDYDISAFLASLSIGSVAVAFAAKDALANVFGSLIIVLDKPFKTGDWIMANGIEGTVEKVSFRSTCIRTFPQELVYVPNSLLSNTPITNFTLREKRRIDLTLGLTYGSTHAQIESFIASMKDYLNHNPRIYDDGSMRVHFTNYNDSSLDIAIVCYARTGDHTEYLNILQEVNLKAMDLMEAAGVSCAFPSTSVYFENELKTAAETKAPDAASN